MEWTFHGMNKRAKTKGSKSICPEEKVAELTSLFVKNGYKPFALNGEPKELKSVDEWPRISYGSPTQQEIPFRRNKMISTLEDDPFL